MDEEHRFIEKSLKKRIESDKKRQRNGKKAFAVSLIFFSISFAILCATFIYIDTKNVVPQNLFSKVLLGAVLFVLLEVFLILSARKRSIYAIISIVLCACIIVVSTIGVRTVYQIYESIKQIEDSDAFYASIGVYVRKDSKFAPVWNGTDYFKNDSPTPGERLDGIKLGVMILNLDRGYGSQAARLFRKEYSDVSVSVYEDFGSLIDALKNKEVDAVLFNEVFIGVFMDEDSDFEEWAVRAESIGIETEHNAIAKRADVVSEPFIVYVSGIDCNQDVIYDSNLSDVNLSVLVDPVKKKILIINTPRDYYLPLWGRSWAMDKLTHAGTYGVDASMSTLSSMLGIEYNYYARVNVFSLIKIVDALGGITVHSDYEFYAASGTGGYHQFYVGDNEVDGIGALCFVRERHSFVNGDRQRGIHQEECIRAIIRKACSPAIIAHFTDVLNVVTSSMKTNIGQDEINALVKMQLEDMASWSVEGIAVDGWGATRPCYAAGGTELWVMIPDEKTIQSAKDKIAEFLA